MACTSEPINTNFEPETNFIPNSSSTPVSLPPTRTEGTRPFYTGWAIDAYPDMSREQMVSAVSKMKKAGANVVWISHANPARSFKDEREVGLNPDVYAAFKDFTRIDHADAVEIVQAQKLMLQICQEFNIKAVLSIGYHTQMGLEWSKLHPQDLRRHPDGTLWNAASGSAPYGSIYSPVFQKDLYEYYKWIEYEFLNPYRNTIQMFNLADEPLGGDYSGWAEIEFHKRNGYGFNEVGNDPIRQQLLGQFQAGVIVDYMKMAAGFWQELAPGLAVTMSYDGGPMREDNGLPNLEALFQFAPANFVFTFEMYPRDQGVLNQSLNEDDITRLFLFVRSVAGYSAQYQRKVWFWSAANSWGLGQNVSKPGTIADAQANILYLTQLMNQDSGNLEGIAVWHYNLKTQGLFNYSWGNVQNKATWNEDQMFEQVSSMFAVAQAINSGPAGKPQLLFLRPPEWQYKIIGAARVDYYKPVIDFASFDILARNNILSITAGHWPSQLPSLWSDLKVVVVLAPIEFLNDTDLTMLRKWIAGGGTVLASIEVSQKIVGEELSQWSDVPSAISFQKGRLFVSRKPTYELFNSTKTAQLKVFWQQLLQLNGLQSNFMIRTQSSYLEYHLGTQGAAEQSVFWPANLNSQVLWRYSSNGMAKTYSQTGWSFQPLERSEFIFGLADK